VLVVSLALFFVLLSAIGLLTWNSYADAIQQSRVRVAAATQVVSTHVEWLTAAGLQILEEVDRVTGNDLTHTTVETKERFQLHLRNMPKGVSLTIVDRDGKSLFSTAEGGSADLNPEDGLDLSQLTGHRMWYVSAMVKASDGKEPSFVIARRLVRNDQTAGAAVLRFPVKIMSEVWESLDLGPGSTVGLMRDDGWLVARHPPARTPTNLSDYVLFTDHLKLNDAGIYDAVSPVDGTTRIVGYRKVSNAPLVVVASIARNEALISMQDQMKRLALFLVPLLIGLGVLAVWVARLLRSDEQMRASLSAAVDRNNLLMREIHHRTKNNLQSVASLMKLQPISDEAKAAMSARIAAMSAVHEQAYRSDHYSDVDLHEYLTLLVDNIRRSTGAGIAITTRFEDAIIDRDLAQPLGLVVNEVISNAVKHAFSGRDSGRIDMTLEMLADDRAELVIRDDGAGFTPSEPSSGMGSRLIRAFVQQLGNDYSYENKGGTRFSIRFAAQRGSGS
jgi:two-component sensor histidine kinase